MIPLLHTSDYLHFLSSITRQPRFRIHAFHGGGAGLALSFMKHTPLQTNREKNPDMRNSTLLGSQLEVSIRLLARLPVV